MIRDPSDGTVAEQKKSELSVPPETKAKADDRMRLEKSREWLKRYFSARGEI